MVARLAEKMSHRGHLSLSQSLETNEDRVVGRRCLITQRGDTEWGARFPDFNPLDLYLSGCINTEDFRTKPEAGELKEANRGAVRGVPREIMGVPVQYLISTDDIHTYA